MIQPEAAAECVAGMEVVPVTCERPCDERRPVVCMDEQPVQETHSPIASTKEQPCRVNDEYQRAGTAAAFQFCEPLVGWRQATTRQRRTKFEWARETAGLLGGATPAASA